MGDKKPVKNVEKARSTNGVRHVLIFDGYIGAREITTVQTHYDSADDTIRLLVDSIIAEPALAGISRVSSVWVVKESNFRGTWVDEKSYHVSA